jgi:hypothetical protein
LQSHLAHQPLHRATGGRNLLVPELAPDLAGAVDLEVLGENPGDFGLQLSIGVEI